MRRIIALSFLLFAVVCQTAARKKEVINPHYITNSSAYNVERLCAGDTSVMLVMKARYSEWKFRRYTVLVAEKDTLRFRHGEVYNRETKSWLPLQQDSSYVGKRYLTVEGKLTERAVCDSVKMFFEPLPKGVKTFSLIEGEPGRWTRAIYGLRVDGKAQKPLLKIPEVAYADRPLPDYTPKQGKSVFRGRIHGVPVKTKAWSYVANQRGLTSEDRDFTKAVIDTTGNFYFEMNPTRPIGFGVTLWDNYINVLMLPGEEIVMDVDLHKLSEYRNDAESEKFVRYSAYMVRSGGLPEVDDVYPLRSRRGKEAFGLHPDSCKKYIHDTYAEFCEKAWNKHLTFCRKIETNKELNPAQREYLTLASEADYLRQRNSFMASKTFAYIPIDSAKMADFKAQMADRTDIHARELTLPHSLKAAYVCFDSSPYDYFAANGLLETPYGRYLSGMRKAEKIAARLQMLQPVTDDREWEDVDSLYHPLLKKLNDNVKTTLQKIKDKSGQFCETPQCEAKDYLDSIVAAHKGRVVFIDFWATWCGPCMMDMRVMESVKAELTARGTDFIYITNESSPADSWGKEAEKHSGFHYRIPSDDWKGMDIPGFSGGIPHYLLYDRNGKLVRSFVGWHKGREKEIKTEIEKLF